MSFPSIITARAAEATAGLVGCNLLSARMMVGGTKRIVFVCLIILVLGNAYEQDLPPRLPPVPGGPPVWPPAGPVLSLVPTGSPVSSPFLSGSSWSPSVQSESNTPSRGSDPSLLLPSIWPSSVPGKSLAPSISEENGISLTPSGIAADSPSSMPVGKQLSPSPVVDMSSLPSTVSSPAPTPSSAYPTPLMADSPSRNAVPSCRPTSNNSQFSNLRPTVVPSASAPSAGTFSPSGSSTVSPSSSVSPTIQPATYPAPTAVWSHVPTVPVSNSLRSASPTAVSIDSSQLPTVLPNVLPSASLQFFAFNSSDMLALWSQPSVALQQIVEMTIIRTINVSTIAVSSINAESVILPSPIGLQSKNAVVLSHLEDSMSRVSFQVLSPSAENIRFAEKAFNSSLRMRLLQSNLRQAGAEYDQPSLLWIWICPNATASACASDTNLLLANDYQSSCGFFQSSGWSYYYNWNDLFRGYVVWLALIFAAWVIVWVVASLVLADEIFASITKWRRGGSLTETDFSIIGTCAITLMCAVRIIWIVVVVSRTVSLHLDSFACPEFSMLIGSTNEKVLAVYAMLPPLQLLAVCAATAICFSGLGSNVVVALLALWRLLLTVWAIVLLVLDLVVVSGHSNVFTAYDIIAATQWTCAAVVTYVALHWLAVTQLKRNESDHRDAACPALQNSCDRGDAIGEHSVVSGNFPTSPSIRESFEAIARSVRELKGNSLCSICLYKLFRMLGVPTVIVAMVLEGILLSPTVVLAHALSAFLLSSIVLRVLELLCAIAFLSAVFGNTSTTAVQSTDHAQNLSCQHGGDEDSSNTAGVGPTIQLRQDDSIDISRVVSDSTEINERKSSDDIEGGFLRDQSHAQEGRDISDISVSEVMWTNEWISLQQDILPDQIALLPYSPERVSADESPVWLHQWLYSASGCRVSTSSHYRDTKSVDLDIATESSDLSTFRDSVFDTQFQDMQVYDPDRLSSSIDGTPLLPQDNFSESNPQPSTATSSLSMPFSLGNVSSFPNDDCPRQIRREKVFVYVAHVNYSIVKRQMYTT